MVVYVVKLVYYSDDDAIICGVYSNLALAGHAAMQFINRTREEDDIVIAFQRYEEPWGYLLTLDAYGYGDAWQFGEIEIIRVTLNE